ncbi:MAG: hypothetical protein KBF75_04795 [Saprospiraceae bacterium]|nr:hypothetical protein [Saprospiraceae bacterium]
MDLLDRLIHFPSVLRSIDDGVIVEKLLLYPFFSLLYILQSIRRQSHQIDEDAVYVPPVLANDTLFTWYKMSQLNQKSVGYKVESTESSLSKIVQGYNMDNSSSVIAVDDGEEDVSQMDDSIDQAEPGQTVEGQREQTNEDLQETLSTDDEGGTGDLGETLTKVIIQKVPIKPRIVFNSIFIKNGMPQEIDEAYSYFEPEKEELSGFAKFLRTKTKVKSVIEYGEEEESIIQPIEDKEVFRETPEIESSDADLVILRQKEIKPEQQERKPKKKKKKHLVDRLVQQSVLDNELLVSEPFAELLHAQGYREKAIKIYEKLITKFPEKKHIFAAKIIQINKENK